ncbi:Ctr copper transporter [Mycena olivaceomarginata]|nr:Ctr copper transporter [Mycena olivaceomarginata]
MPRCSMNMLWNTQVVDTCVVFALSCAVIMALGVLYEALCTFQRNIDARIAHDIDPTTIHLRGELIFSQVSSPSVSFRTPIPLAPRMLRAILYGASVFLSFFLMLVFMTYNAYLILATVLGAALGHFIFNGTADVFGKDGDKGMVCH